MKFVNYVTYSADKSKIAANRPRHRECLSRLLKQGKLVASGPFTDDSGALFIYEVGSVEAAAAIVAEDPFSETGVFQKCELKPWTLVFASAELLAADR